MDPPLPQRYSRPRSREGPDTRRSRTRNGSPTPGQRNPSRALCRRRPEDTGRQTKRGVPPMRLIYTLLTTLLLFLTQSPGAFAQSLNNVLSGSVKDSASGNPLSGVSVFLNSTSKGTVTRADGSF